MNPDKMSSTKTGPYRTIKAEVDDWYVVQGPTMVFGSHGWMELHEANILCDRLNAAYAAGQESSRWIPVSERKPEHIRHIAMLFPGDRVVTGGYLPTFDTWMDDGQGELEKPTHWFYIPEAPKH